MSNDVELLQQMTSVLELRQWLRDKRTYAMGSANEVGMTRETLQELDNTLGRLMDGGVVTPQPEHVEWQSLLSDPAANQPSRVTEEALRPATPVVSAAPQATVNSVDDRADQASEPDRDVVDESAEPTAPVDGAEDEGKEEPVVVSDTPDQLNKMETDRADKTSQAFRSFTASVNDADDADDQAGDSAVAEPTPAPEEAEETPTDQPTTPDALDSLWNDVPLPPAVDDATNDEQSTAEPSDEPVGVSQSVDSAIKPTSTDTGSDTQTQSNSGIPFDDLLTKGQAMPLE